MKSSASSILISAFLAVASIGCEHAKPATHHAPTKSPDDRPYNLEKSQFEDPTPPKHRTSPGDADR